MTELTYWDTGIFLAWFLNEQRQPGEMDGIRYQASLVEQKKVRIITSTITIVEVLESKLPVPAREQWLNFTRRPDCILFAVTQTIARMAQEIRNYYSLKTDGYPTVTTPDAIHLATAIHAKCNVFYTLDAQNKVGKQRGLLPLHGYFAGRYRLRIEMPNPPDQVQLDLR
ncbi:MAG: PIN domain-containing protein [Armatimonadota bacterium]|nr:PIN domain-containing protein [Armatimonadota bacterium]